MWLESSSRRERCAKDCLLPWFFSKYRERKDMLFTSYCGRLLWLLFFFCILWLRTRGASTELSKDSAQEQTHDFLHELHFMGVAIKQMWCKSELWLGKPDLESSTQYMVLYRHLYTIEILRNCNTSWKNVESQQRHQMAFDPPAFLPSGITQKEELATDVDAEINIKWSWRAVEEQVKELSIMLKIISSTFKTVEMSECWMCHS